MLEVCADRIRVRGLLSVETVADYQGVGFDAIAEVGEQVKFDLDEAEIIGSAVIALIISWQRRTLKLGKQFSVVNAPQNLLAMAEVSGVLDLIGFSQ